MGGGCQTVSIPSVSIEEGTYREGDETQGTVAGQPTYDDLTMVRWFDPNDTSLWDWIDEIRGGGNRTAPAQREIAVIVNDTGGNARTRWEFTGCWPNHYEPTDPDASADGDVATGSITVVFDGTIGTEW